MQEPRMDDYGTYQAYQAARRAWLRERPYVSKRVRAARGLPRGRRMLRTEVMPERRARRIRER